MLRAVAFCARACVKFKSSSTVRMLKKLATMNAMKTELRQCNLEMIITVDTIHSSAGRGILPSCKLSSVRT